MWSMGLTDKTSWGTGDCPQLTKQQDEQDKHCHTLNVWVSNSLDPDEMPGYLASCLDQSCLNMY